MREKSIFVDPNAPRIGPQLTDVPNCPHCGVSAPVLIQCWASSEKLPRADKQPSSHWAAYRCTTCGHVVTAKGKPDDKASNAVIDAYFPAVWEPSTTLPQRVSAYLRQARATLRSPDASVVMSASAIDAMMKDNGLVDGSLYSRIEAAVKSGVLTQRMADWAHRVRLDANNPRHADANTRHMSAEDAQRAFDFAEALGEFLYVLPSRMPPKLNDEQIAAAPAS